MKLYLVFFGLNAFFAGLQIVVGNVFSAIFNALIAIWMAYIVVQEAKG